MYPYAHIRKCHAHGLERMYHYTYIRPACPPFQSSISLTCPLLQPTCPSHTPVYACIARLTLLYDPSYYDCHTHLCIWS